MTKRPNLPEPAPIQEVLNKILKPSDLRQLEFQARLRQVWEQNISHLLGQHTELVDFNKKTLYVEVAAKSLDAGTALPETPYTGGHAAAIGGTGHQGHQVPPEIDVCAGMVGKFLLAGG